MHAVLYASLVTLSFAAICPAQTSTPSYLASQSCYSDGQCCKYNSQCSEGCCDSITWTCLDRSKGFDLVNKNQANTCKIWNGPQAYDLNSYLESEIKMCAAYNSDGQAIVAAGVAINLISSVIGIIIAVGAGIAFIVGLVCLCKLCSRNTDQNNEIRKNIDKMSIRVKQLGGIIDMSHQRSQVVIQQPYGQPMNPQMQQRPPVNQFGQNQQMGQFGHPGYAQQQPVYAQQQPVYSQQQPVYGQQQPVYGQQQPVYGQQQPVYGQQQPVYGQQQPVFGQQQPVYGQQQPVYGQPVQVYPNKLQDI